MPYSFELRMKRDEGWKRVEWRSHNPSELAREELAHRERFAQLHNVCFKVDNPWQVLVGGLPGWLRARYLTVRSS